MEPTPKRMLIVSAKTQARLESILEQARDEFSDAASYCEKNSEDVESLEKKSDEAQHLLDVVREAQAFDSSALPDLMERACADCGPEDAGYDEVTNEQRAAWAEAALDEFREQVGDDATETSVQDLVTDLCHLLARTPELEVPVEKVIANGYAMYRTEVENEKYVAALAVRAKAAKKNRTAAELRVKKKEKKGKKS